MYDAFVSYSHAKDKPIAAALQSVMQNLGKAWWQRRKLRVFRDETSLTAAPEMWPEIEANLISSRFLVLMASPEAAASEWVDREVATWLTHHGHEHGPATLLIVLTEGELTWDRNNGDFAWGPGTPLPPSIRGKFKSEPLWVDLRAYRSGAEHASRQNRAFSAQTAKIAARILRVPLEDLLSEELTQQRRALRLAWSAAASLMILAGVALWQWQAVDAAERQGRRTLALSDQQKAIELFTRSGETDATMPKPGRALAYLARAIRNDSSNSAIGRRAIYLMAEHPHLYGGGAISQVSWLEPRSLQTDEYTSNSTTSEVLRSPDGTWELSLGEPLKVRRSGENEWQEVKEKVEFGLDHTTAAFPEHNRYAAVGGGFWTEFGGYSEVKLVDAHARVIGRHVFTGEKVARLALSPDGRMLFASIYSPRTGGGGTGRDRARAILFSVNQEPNSTADLAEIRVFDDPITQIRFSADSRLALLENQPFEVGPVLSKEPLPGFGWARAAFFSADGKQIFAQSVDAQTREVRWSVYDAVTRAPADDDATATLPLAADRSGAFNADASADRILITMSGKPVFDAADPRILLAGVSAMGDRLILIRDDGQAELAQTATGALAGAWRPLTSIYGSPWHEWTSDFVTLSGGRAESWTRIFRREDVEQARWQKAFQGIAHHFSDVSTRVALHPSGKTVAVASMGHSIARVRALDIISGGPLFDPIDIAEQYVDPFFSRDGKWLYLHASNSGSAMGAFELREVANGLPLTRSRLYAGPFAERPDGKRMLDGGGGGDGDSGLIDLLGGESPVPSWVADLAEGLSGSRLDSQGVLVRLSTAEQNSRIDAVRKALATEATDPWKDFGRWYLSADRDPPISPYSTMRRSELAALKLTEERARSTPASPLLETQSAGESAVRDTPDVIHEKHDSPAAVLPPKTKTDGPYFVQVGAYSDRAKAQQQLLHVAAQFSDLMRDRQTDIVPLNSGGTYKFRARFIGFVEADARTACATLQKQRTDCFVASRD